MKKGKKTEICIKRKLFGYLAIFTGFILIIVWVFQVLLLGTFYKNIKQDELKNASTALINRLGDVEALDRKIEEILGDSMIYTRVFKIDHIEEKDEHIAIRIDTHKEWAGDYYLKDATVDELNDLLNKAINNGGVYYFNRTVKDIASESGDADEKSYKDIPEEMVYIEFAEVNGEMYIIMLNMIYTPLGAMVRTLNIQFVWIAIILLLGALTLSAIISYRISKPLVKMNDSAKLLAEGNYQADFSGEGFKEVVELGDALNYASAELSKADNLQKDLLANISHDLRTPLTMITGYSEVMRDIPGENTAENVQVIIDESTRLTELVNDLLDLSKIQAGTVRFEKTVFDLTETVQSTMQRYRKLTHHDGFRIEFFSDENVLIEADRTRMLQVVYNLINNALNYSGDDKLVQVRQTVANGKVRISVTDYGEGIAQEDIPQIWDRYYKVDKAHKRAVIGTGLGLSIVKGILEAHNAAYGVESEVGAGSTFWFELPIVE